DPAGPLCPRHDADDLFHFGTAHAPTLACRFGGRQAILRGVSDVIAAIASAHGAAREAWPGIDVDLARFEAELRPRLGGAPATQLPRISTRDVYLAIACLDGDEAAIVQLERDFLQELQFAARRLRATEAMVGDVRGHLRRILFTAEQDRGAALAAFTGRAKL